MTSNSHEIPKGEERNNGPINNNMGLVSKEGCCSPGHSNTSPIGSKRAFTVDDDNNPSPEDDNDALDSPNMSRGKNIADDSSSVSNRKARVSIRARSDAPMVST